MSGIPTVALYANDKEINKVWKKWATYKTCARCGQSFNLLSSFGKWNCKQHPFGLSSRLIKKTTANNFDNVYEDTEDQIRYWECCKKRPNRRFRNDMDKVWRNFSCTRCPIDLQGKCYPEEGCKRADHIAYNGKYDDGYRDKINWKQIAPLGGWKLGDEVKFKHNGETGLYAIEDMKWDGSLQLANVEFEVHPRSVWAKDEWILEFRNNVWANNDEPHFCNVNTPEPAKCQILSWEQNNDNNIKVLLKEVGTPLHGIAAMIPFMGEAGKDDPMQRPGFQQASKEFPFITRVELRNID